MITFDNFGTDLMVMTNAWKWCSKGSPVFKDVVLRLGDEGDEFTGALRAISFTNMLKRLGTPLAVARLSIFFERFHYFSNEQIEEFALALANVKIHCRLALITCDRSTDLFAITDIVMKECHMKVVAYYKASIDVSASVLAHHSEVLLPGIEVGGLQINL